MNKLTIYDLTSINRKVIEKPLNLDGKRVLSVYSEKDTKPVDYIEEDKNLFAEVVK